MDVLLFLIIFVIIPTIIIRKFKPKFVDFELCFILLKFKKGKNIFDTLAQICPRFWHFIGEFGIVIAFGLLGSVYLLRKGLSLKKCLVYQILHTILSILLIVFITKAFVIHLFIITALFGTSFFMICLIFEKAISIIHDYLVGSSYVSPGVAPIIPGVKLKNVPSYLQVPIYTIISLALIIIIHEAFHGILCRLEKIDLKSYGLLFLGLIPFGAFVEPDEESLNKKSSLQKNKMYAAGSMGNFLLFIIFFIIWILLQNILTWEGIEFKTYYNITQTYKNFTEITPGTYIYSIIYDQSKNALGLNTSKGYIILKNTSLNEFFAYINYKIVVSPENMYWLFVLLDIIKYTWLLSLMVGLINYIPLLIFDGARMFEEISMSLFRNNKIVLYLNLFVLFLFLINALPLFI